ncbi:MAG TPA: cytochrome c oxidase subunit II, partial [Actinomycetota bacterium]|nr:cytochrome c oxidase subunit II [Actinomycetota bacterium]
MRRARLIGIVLVAVLVLAGCGSLTPVTEEGAEIRDLYNILFVAAAVIFVLVEAAIVFAVVRYRRRSDMLPPQFHGNNLLEVAWTVVPLVIVAALFVLTWGVLNRVEAKADDPRVTVNVLGFQWQWQFTYQGESVPLPPGQPAEDLTIKGTIAKPPVVYLPVGEPIRFNTQAQEVIHSFYVREFLFKRDAFPDHVNTFDLTITKPGDYGGQ